jgi:deazaflavin-dependent oxidoreductase (nitroreductase family)
MSDMQDFNTSVINEFRANGGKVGGMFEGAPMVLITTKGAKSGVERVTPLMCLPDGESIAIFASMGGAPQSPAWFHNILANPIITVEYGTETFTARAEQAPPDERNRLYALQAQRYPQFAEYESKTTRTIPVVVITRNPA